MSKFLAARPATRLLYREDPYRQQAPACVIGHTAEGAVILDQSIFCPACGGQPGDSGWLSWAGRRLAVATAVLEPGGGADCPAGGRGRGGVALVPAVPEQLPAVGVALVQMLDWTRRYRRMRLHTALHLLAALVARPSAAEGIADMRAWAEFAAPAGPRSRASAPDAATLAQRLNTLVARDLPVVGHGVTPGELRDMAVVAGKGIPLCLGGGRPAHGSDGPLRLIGIGEGGATVDLRLCAGIHVARTGEIGAIAVERASAAEGWLRVTIALAGELSG